MVRKVRSSRGSRPGPEWTYVETTEDETGRWSVYTKPQTNNPAWCYAKVVAHGWRKGKANFWLSRSAGRFASVGDIARLAQDKADLLAKVSAMMDRAEGADLV